MLVEALRSAVAAAQDAISARRAAELRRCTELAGHASPEGSGDFLELSLEEPGGAGARMTRWPWLTLRPLIMPEITALSLEFDAAIEETAATGIRRWRRAEPRPLALVIKRGRGDEAPARALHRVRINLTGRQPGSGEIVVDGVLFKRFGAEPST